MSRRFRTGIRLLAALALGACTAGEDTPAGGTAAADAADVRVLAQTIALAARARDYDTLAAHMADAFSYSFGREPSRAGGIERFRAEPGRLDTLAEVLGGDCAYKDVETERWFICPATAADAQQAYYGWRAGFRQRADGRWEFAWFIAGD